MALDTRVFLSDHLLGVLLLELDPLQDQSNIVVFFRHVLHQLLVFALLVIDISLLSL